MAGFLPAPPRAPPTGFPPGSEIGNAGRAATFEGEGETIPVVEESFDAASFATPDLAELPPSMDRRENRLETAGLSSGLPRGLPPKLPRLCPLGTLKLPLMGGTEPAPMALGAEKGQSDG